MKNLIPINGWEILSYIGIIILIWFALREIRTWYWKQDAIVDLLKDINKKLDKLIVEREDTTIKK